MAADILVINSKSALGRVLLIAGIVVVILLTWFGVRWQLGNMLTSLTLPTDADAGDVADLADSLAPSDPQSSWLRASVTQNESSTAATVEEFQNTVRLSPYDFRWRIELGRALEQDGDPARAEAEFRKAVDLAPSYAYPRWHLGNFLLRQNRPDEAFAELKLAAAYNYIYRDQVFSVAWDYFDKDSAKVEEMAADSSQARAYLALFFAARGRADDALRNWNMLSDADKQANPQLLRSMAQGLFLQRHFPQSLEFLHQQGIDTDAMAEAVTNGSFEKPLSDTDDSRFNWQVIRNDTKIEISTDNKVKQDGSKSVRLTFRNFAKPDLSNLLQTVVVRPAAAYRLTFWVRTENLKSGGPPLIEISDANTGKTIALSKTVNSGTTDWQQMSVDFKTPDDCDGILLRTTRVSCGDVCPINGILWYDGFDLERR
jgi:tetratricopeptide (TPR) repeat protein